MPGMTARDGRAMSCPRSSVLNWKFRTLEIGGWPGGKLPREEFIGDGTFGHEDRFPTPAIFPKYSLTVD